MNRQLCTVIKLNSKNLFFICFVAIFIFYLTYNFFFIKNFAAYPWYHAENNDSDAYYADAYYAAQTLGIINNGFIKCTFHPGATISSVHGLVYKILSEISDSFGKMTNLSEVKNLKDGFKILNKATKTSRILALFTGYLFAVLLLGVFYQFTKDPIISFLFTFYVVTSPTFLFHSYVVRPEALNLFFFFCAVFIFQYSICKENISLNRFISGFLLIGLFLGFSVMSKIQICPLIIFFIGVMFLYLFWSNKTEIFIKEKSKNMWLFCLLTSLVNIALTPWWSLTKPLFLTPEYLEKIKNNDFGRLYGPAPESFAFLVFIILFILVLISLLFFVFDKKQLFKVITSKSLPSAFAFNVLNLGILVSVYLIFLPVSKSFGSYIDNTHHLIYSTLTNVIYGGFIDTNIDTLITMTKIFRMHNTTSQILGINVVHLVWLAMIYCIIKLFYQSGGVKKYYLLIMFLFFIGIFMDYFSTMRFTPWSPGYLFNHYAIYSIIFFAIGLAKLMSLELRKQVEGYNIKKYIHVFRALALILLISHAIQVSYNFYKEPKESGKSSEELYISKQYNITRGLATPYWEIVDAAIESHKK